MSDQFLMFDEAPPAQPKRKRPSDTQKSERPLWKKTIEERCADFDAKCPEVYKEIRRLAIAALQSGKKRIGIGHLVEVARWNLETNGRDPEGYKLNNSFRAIWVRRLIAEVPALAPLFELRERRAA